MMKKLIETNISVGYAVKLGTAYLQEHNIENAAYDSFALFASITGMSRTDYFMKTDEVLSDEILCEYEKCIRLRAEHIPLQHIIGKAYFYGREFQVNQNVLIPRPDTEILVEQTLQILKEENSVLDMCTGSGCIILTLALENKLKKAIGVDLSLDALEVAKKNYNQLQAENVDFIQSDLFTELNGVYDHAFDLIVSNPPYIRSDVIPTLSEEVRLHDPMLALDGFDDGLYFYRKITEAAPAYLKKGGWLMYEIGYDQGKDVSEMMKISGFEDISVIQDLAGLDRVVRGRLL